MNNLIFFNKNGDSYNFIYNNDSEKYEGDILFDRNSNDTFKEENIYTFEKVEAFEYEDVEALSIKKFQLFNEYGFRFYSGSKSGQVTSIEPSNNRGDFFSKWIFGTGFENIFPKGSLIRFTNPIFEFNSFNQTYTVVANKKNAIMIISIVDNITFNSTYNWQNTNYSNISIESVNAIGVYNYIDLNNLSEELSTWNEKDFYNRLYVGRKLNLMNTGINDEYKPQMDYALKDIVTISNVNIPDVIYNQYSVTSNLITDDLTMRLNIKKDSGVIYNGGIDIWYSPNPLGISNVIDFQTVIPDILKPGVRFSIKNSITNPNVIFVINDIQNFKGNANKKTYNIGEQVLWNNKIYQCIQTYTWVANNNDDDISVPQLNNTPTDVLYWGTPTYLPILNTVVDETLSTTEIYLEDFTFNFTQAFTISSNVTAASLVELYKDIMIALDINLSYRNNTIYATLLNSSQYAYVEFIVNNSVISTNKNIIERVIEVDEQISTDMNSVTSENYSYNILFKNIDGNGLIFDINGQLYETNTVYRYSVGLIDAERTIDATLRNWVQLNAIELLTRGIIVNLQIIGNGLYVNSINISTEYPNVPLDFIILVGDNSVYNILHSSIVFYDPSMEGVDNPFSSHLDININGRSYPIEKTTDITTVLQNWYNKYYDILVDYGIITSINSSVVEFSVLQQDTRCEIVVSTGYSLLPGDINEKTIKRISGEHGALITSNEVLLGTQSTSLDFLQAGFSTGMITGLNETPYPLQNVEFNILYLGQNSMNLSYEGPFWSSTFSCNTNSPYTSIGFSAGFQESNCISYTQSTGQFSSAFSSAFMISFNNTPTYSVTQYTSPITNIVDIIHFNMDNSMFILGDNLLIRDSITGDVKQIVMLPGTTPISMLYNNIDGYIWVLKNDRIFLVNPYTYDVYDMFTTSGAFNMTLNKMNGDVYITNNIITEIYNTGGLVASIVSTPVNIEFSEFENVTYIFELNNIIRVNGTNRSIIDNIITLDNVLIDDTLYDTNTETIFFWTTNGLRTINNGVINTLVPNIALGGNWLLHNTIIEKIFTSNITEINRLGLNNSVDFTNSLSVSGHMTLNHYDGDIYISNTVIPSIVSINPIDGTIRQIINLSDMITKTVYNSDNGSIWGIQPTTGGVVEVKSLISFIISQQNITSTSIIDSPLLGTLDPNYVTKDYLWLQTREFLRKPRRGFSSLGETNNILYWKWFSDNVPEFFLFDFSGELLPTDGPLAYKGLKPLPEFFLNTKANRDIEYTSDASRQQTVFKEIEYVLPFIDDIEDNTNLTNPLNLSIGYKAVEEGPLRSILQLYINEDVEFILNTNIDQTNIVSLETIIDGDERYGIIRLDNMSNELFTQDSNGLTRGLKEGQHLAIFVSDETNQTNQYISKNNGYLVRIREIYSRNIVVDFFKDIDHFTTESSIVNNYPIEGNITYLSFRLVVWDKEIGRFNVYGQTEIEDIRYRLSLNNIGKLISPDKVFIFKEYDIKEEGIDWEYLNKKRKEMLMVRGMIYPHIGNYKSIINAINYFGYNDLELSEYYRNIKVGDPNFDKLHKVEIPNIFNPIVEGWEDNDFVKGTFPNTSYEDTNLFNLTYRITDTDGNNTLLYSLREVQIKLQGLKYWLKDNIIPITHRILDITGRADFNHINTITHTMKDINIIKFKEELTPITFKMNEAYLMPVNNGSTVYTCVIDFYIADSNYPTEWTVDVSTYQTYREWYPLKTYNTSDRVFYMDGLYESYVNNNKAYNPRQYDNIDVWTSDIYEQGDLVSYNGNFYVYSGVGNTASITDIPYNNNNWIDVTKWRKIKLLPIQKISENRRSNDMKPFNFTLDSNIDPFIMIELTSYNDRGAVFKCKKYYEVRGILDLQELEAFSNLTQTLYNDTILERKYII